MTNKSIEIIIVLVIVAFIIYRGIRNAEKERHKFMYIFCPKKIGVNPPEPFKCRDLEELREHPMFKHWRKDYRLWLSNISNTVKMVRNGDTYDYGTVVGWIEHIPDQELLNE